MESLLSIWKRHTTGTGANWGKYPHWFKTHDSMKAEAENYTVSLAEIESGGRAFIVGGQMELLRREWARIYAAEHDGELPESDKEPRAKQETRNPREWAKWAAADYRQEHARGVCSNSRGGCAVALQYFAEYVAEALAAFGVEWEGRTESEQRETRKRSPREPRETKPGGVALPLELDTDEAREKFAGAVARGWMVQKGNGYEWQGAADKGKGAQLAYFLGKVYGYRWGYDYSPGGGNVGERVPWRALQTLFSFVGDLHKTISQVYGAAKPQPWRRIIDTLF